VAPTFVGLTGGMGVGKSEALRAFERAGAATLASDQVVHDLLRSGEVRARLLDRWGEGVVSADDEIDRSQVAEIVFERPEELRWLEAELHPRVAERVMDWRAKLPAEEKLAVVEVPLLFETGMEELFDAVVSVVADRELTEERSAASGLIGLGGRSGRQLSQAEKAARATHVVRNDGTLADLEAKIDRLVGELTGSGDGGDHAQR
jgi:dephospho-CoA kinase